MAEVLRRRARAHEGGAEAEGGGAEGAARWEVMHERCPVGVVHVAGAAEKGLKEGELVVHKLVAAASGRSVLYDLFLPQGYPQSVREGYLAFQLFDSVQGLCSYLRGVLSTQAILEGFGVGVENANALAATTQWVYRDGAGMLGGLVFAWAGAPVFDRNVKRWRLFADFAVDLALTIELASPLVCGSTRSCFTASVCGANVLKAMCGVAAGATRAVVTVHFAKEGNTADVQAKEGSQETFVNLLGMVLGLWLAGFVEEHKSLVWVIFFALTALHLIANYLAVQALRLSSLNEPRLSSLIERFRAGDLAGMTVDQINAAEPILGRSKHHFVLGAPLPAGAADERLAHALLHKLGSQPCAALPGRRANEVAVLLRDDATPRDCLAAIIMAADPTLDPARFLRALEDAGWDVSGRLPLADLGYRFRPSTA